MYEQVETSKSLKTQVLGAAAAVAFFAVPMGLYSLARHLVETKYTCTVESVRPIPNAVDRYEVQVNQDDKKLTLEVAGCLLHGVATDDILPKLKLGHRYHLTTEGWEGSMIKLHENIVEAEELSDLVR